MPAASPANTDCADWLTQAYSPAIKPTDLHDHLIGISTRTTKKVTSTTSPTNSETAGPAPAAASHKCKTTIKLWFAPPKNGNRKKEKKKKHDVEFVAGKQYPAVLPQVVLSKTLARQALDTIVREKRLPDGSVVSCYLGNDKVELSDLIRADTNRIKNRYGKKISAKRYKELFFVLLAPDSGSDSDSDPRQLSLRDYVERIWDEILRLTEFREVVDQTRKDRRRRNKRERRERGESDNDGGGSGNGGAAASGGGGKDKGKGKAKKVTFNFSRSSRRHGGGGDAAVHSP